MENIRVSLRVRPLMDNEISKNEENCWGISDCNTLNLLSKYQKEAAQNRKQNCQQRSQFVFDKVSGKDDDNYQIYQNVVKNIALSSLNGINGTIFVYGQTGTGKTFTMMGTEYNYIAQTASNRPFKLQDQNHQENIKCQSYLQDNSFNEEQLISISSKDKNESCPGILVYALRDIFQAIDNDLDKTYFLKCSYVEIYNDQIFDLLNSSEQLSDVLTISEDSKKGFYIKGVNEISVSNIEEILKVIKLGEINRHYASTSMNHISSRSHTIFRLSVQTLSNNNIRNQRKQQKYTCNINNKKLRNSALDIKTSNLLEGTLVTESLLNFVDLAGSEKVSAHQFIWDDSTLLQGGASDSYSRIDKDLILQSIKMKDRIKEGQHINKSLFFLTQVISLKSEGKSDSHIPYRNSPLTKILRSSLGGNSRTLILLCITPAASQVDQSLSTIRFGLSAKKIENKVEPNIKKSNEEDALRLLILDCEKKLKDQEKCRQNDKLYQQQLEQKIKELESKLKTKKKNDNKIKQNLNNKLEKQCIVNQNEPINVTQEAEEISYSQQQLTNIQERDEIIFLKEQRQFCFQALEKAKIEIFALKQKISLFEDNYQKLNEKYFKFFVKNSESNDFKLKNGQIAQQILQNFNTLNQIDKKLVERLQLYEKEDMLQCLNENDFQQLELKAEKTLNNIRLEKSRRSQQQLDMKQQKKQIFQWTLDDLIKEIFLKENYLEKQLRQLSFQDQLEYNEKQYICDLEEKENNERIFCENIQEMNLEVNIASMELAEIEENIIAPYSLDKSLNQNKILINQTYNQEQIMNNTSKLLNQYFQDKKQQEEAEKQFNLENQKLLGAQGKFIEKNQYIEEDSHQLNSLCNEQSLTSPTIAQAFTESLFIEKEKLLEQDFNTKNINSDKKRQEVFINLSEINGRKRYKNDFKPEKEVKQEQKNCSRSPNISRQNSNSGRALLISQALYLKAKNSLEAKFQQSPDANQKSDCILNTEYLIDKNQLLLSQREGNILANSEVQNQAEKLLTGKDYNNKQNYLKGIDENTKPLKGVY